MTKSECLKKSEIQNPWPTLPASADSRREGLVGPTESPGAFLAEDEEHNPGLSQLPSCSLRPPLAHFATSRFRQIHPVFVLLLTSPPLAHFACGRPSGESCQPFMSCVCGTA